MPYIGLRLQGALRRGRQPWPGVSAFVRRDLVSRQITGPVAPHCDLFNFDCDNESFQPVTFDVGGTTFGIAFNVTWSP